jgi:hemoglobin
METSIYEQIGGAPAVSAAVDLFYKKVWEDPSLVPYFNGIDRGRLKAHQRAFLTAALGGPQSYNGRAMDKAHAGLGITDAAFDQVVVHLADTLTELGVDEATLAQIAGALGPLRADIVEQAPPVAEETRGLRKLLRRGRLIRSA